MDKKINQAVIRIPCNLQEFFFYWVKFLKPLHNLTEREIQVAAELLLERYEISKTLEDPNFIDTVLLSPESKTKIREKVGITVQHFNCVYKRLKEVKIIVNNNQINKRFIPKLYPSENNFNLTLFFEFDICK